MRNPLGLFIPAPVTAPYSTWSAAKVMVAALGLGLFFWVLHAWSDLCAWQRAAGPGELPPGLFQVLLLPGPEHLLVRCLVVGSCLATGLVAVLWVRRFRNYERDLARGERRLELALEQADLAIWEYSPLDGHTIARARCEHLFGLPQGPSGKTAVLLGTLAEKDDYARATAMVNACVEGRPHSPYCDYRLVRPDGSPRWIRDRCQVLERSDSGTALRLLRTFQDVTIERHDEDDRVRLTLAAERSQRLDSLGMMAGQIAHDFRNYLTAILGCADGLGEALPPGSAGAEDLEAIRRAAQRGRDLCQQLMAYSGTATPSPRPTDVGRALVEARSILATAVGRRAWLALQVAPDLWASIDPTQLSQVVLNLAINAAEAMGDKAGPIAIELTPQDGHDGLGTGYVLGDQLGPGRYCLLQVRDEGCGMDASVAARVFEPFYSTKAEGRGLGMPAVLGIVRRHHGAIRLNSQPGRGTAVSILLPRVARPADAPTMAPTGVAQPAAGADVQRETQDAHGSHGRSP